VSRLWGSRYGARQGGGGGDDVWRCGRLMARGGAAVRRVSALRVAPAQAGERHPTRRTRPSAQASGRRSVGSLGGHLYGGCPGARRRGVGASRRVSIRFSTLWPSISTKP
jgi:hypothetical protein